MTINLFDDSRFLWLRPLTFTRPVADLRIGILTIAEKWATWLDADFGFITAPYLSLKYPAKQQQDFCINGSICPDESLLTAILELKPGQLLYQGDCYIAWRPEDASHTDMALMANSDQVSYSQPFVQLNHVENIFMYNDVELRKDFALLTKGKTSAQLSATNTLLGDHIFVEQGAIAECATFNSLQGPIYLGKNTEVCEGSNIRGSFALGQGSQVKMGAKIYGKTTIGPYSRVGGEINNSVIWGYSSKGHEGYLGNAVLGQWCNMGAGSNNSNLKNNYGKVKLWDYGQENFRETGLQFCGLVMGDHAKCAINTQFNTGTVAGVSANVFGMGFPRNFIPDFAWGGAHGFEGYQLNKMLETTAMVYERRNRTLDSVEIAILSHVFQITQQYRRF